MAGRKGLCALKPGPAPERNRHIRIHSGIHTIFDTSEPTTMPGITIIHTSSLYNPGSASAPRETNDDELAYILYTSGTTGVPKGVPITRANISAFVNACDHLISNITENDKWLQMFDLTFDLSVMSFLVPLLKGACVYTVPAIKTKYKQIFKLIDEQNITGALLVPSIIHFIRPYFPEIHSDNMKYCLFCGEALSTDLVEGWQQCIPNATILNAFGPTENTIFCTSYQLTNDKTGGNKSFKDVLSIGRPFPGTYAIIASPDNAELPAGEKGELCLGGKQLTPGYWKNEQRNKEAFFPAKIDGKYIRFYKTGDLCFKDADGDIMYVGRIDTQVKIQGYRVELLEVEFYAKKYLETLNVVATTFSNSTGNIEIALIIESKMIDSSGLLDYMKEHLPSYMIPSRVLFESVFPYNNNGKIDRNSLKQSVQLK